MYEEKETDTKYDAFIHKFKNIFNENCAINKYKINKNNNNKTGDNSLKQQTKEMKENLNMFMVEKI